jgi:hypothetical protein
MTKVAMVIIGVGMFFIFAFTGVSYLLITTGGATGRGAPGGFGNMASVGLVIIVLAFVGIIVTIGSVIVLLLYI